MQSMESRTKAVDRKAHKHEWFWHDDLHSVAAKQVGASWLYTSGYETKLKSLKSIRPIANCQIKISVQQSQNMEQRKQNQALEVHIATMSSYEFTGNNNDSTLLSLASPFQQQY
ncbi:hypothetical protein VNO77_27706 [Canavalia gladiata]|uniref:Uncharacterized protein n=1 Tax=Canavalia gladiata TaxID=3824 RepID=A0AAN9KUH9_CANGL